MAVSSEHRNQELRKLFRFEEEWGKNAQACRPPINMATSELFWIQISFICSRRHSDSGR
jgi:hypothetical protein